MYKEEMKHSVEAEDVLQGTGGNLFPLSASAHVSVRARLWSPAAVCETGLEVQQEWK